MDYRFWQQPYTKPLIRWGPELRDRWLMPHYLIQDFQAVLKELKTAGYAFELDWFAPLLLRRFPQHAKLSLSDNPGHALEIRTALEPCPVMGDVSHQGALRLIDSSMERLQLFLTGAVGETPHPGTLASRYIILCNGHPVPLRSTGVAGDYVGAVRFRTRGLGSTPSPPFSPQVPLWFEVIDTWQSRFLGGVKYDPQVPRPADLSLPDAPGMARSRLRSQCSPLLTGTVPDPLPPLRIHPDAPMTLDLRLVTQALLR
ncbi:MAG: transglutaminase family protein [Leptolyngbyaceae cyanobacterium]